MSFEKAVVERMDVTIMAILDPLYRENKKAIALTFLAKIEAMSFSPYLYNSLG